MTAERAEGVPSLVVRFTGGGEGLYEGDFGDGARSTGASPEHTYSSCAFRLGETEPWGWIRVGGGPLPDLEGLRSFTNQTINKHGLDRQFRGALRGIQVFGSRISSRGALPLDQIGRLQAAGMAVQ